MSRSSDGDIDVLVLKFAHILRKKLARRQAALAGEIDKAKNLTLKAEMIQSQYILSAIVKSFDETISEFRSDGVNAGALYPKRRNPKVITLQRRPAK